MAPQSISTSFRVHAAPKSWSKYTTLINVGSKEYDRNTQQGSTTIETSVTSPTPSLNAVLQKMVDCQSKGFSY